MVNRQGMQKAMQALTTTINRNTYKNYLG